MSSTDIISPPAGSAKTNPFLASPSEPVTITGSTPTANQRILDLFNTPVPDKNANEGTTPTPASDDLLCLNNNLSSNPFADSLFGGQQQQQQSTQQQQQQDQAFAAFTNGKYLDFSS